jgi:hypothetical protein
MSKKNLYQEAVKEARTMLSRGEDYQEVGHTLINKRRFDLLFEGKDEDELFEYVNGIVRMAENQLGFR